MTPRRTWQAAAGVLALAGAMFLPASWFIPLPPTTPVPAPPVSGHFLVRVALVLDGLLLLWLAFLRTAPLRPEARPARRIGNDEEARFYGWLVAGVTLLALVLRLISVNADLWLDEVTPVRAYRDATAWQVFITYRSSNNHLLNTLLVKAVTAVFGEQEWAIRLPAVLWGTATIPVFYWVARQALTRYASLWAAGLLAVSYHHIFFSQNARGYSAYVFLSLLSSGLLVKGLDTNAPRVWAGYVVATVANFASHLISGFVFAAHFAVAGASALASGETGRPARLGRVLSIFGLTAFLGFQLYAAVLPQVYVLMGVVYTEGASGFTPFSIDLVREVVRGLSAGFGPGLLLGAAPLFLLAAIGFAILVKRHWKLAMALTLPCVVQALVLMVQGLTFSPRFFVLVLPLAILVAVQAVDTTAAALARRMKRDAGFARILTTVAMVLLAAASLSALPRYYAVPKQAYRAALARVEATRPPDGVIVEIHYAEAGLRYYRHQTGLGESPYYFQARTVAALDDILAAHANSPVWLLTSFPRALRIGVPDLDARIKRDWKVAESFPGTIGDGTIYLWKQVNRQP